MRLINNMQLEMEPSGNDMTPLLLVYYQATPRRLGSHYYAIPWLSRYSLTLSRRGLTTGICLRFCSISVNAIWSQWTVEKNRSKVIKIACQIKPVRPLFPNCTKRIEISSKTTQTLIGDNFLLDSWMSDKIGLTVLVFDQRTKLSSPVFHDHTNTACEWFMSFTRTHNRQAIDVAFHFGYSSQRVSFLCF